MPTSAVFRHQAGGGGVRVTYRLDGRRARLAAVGIGRRAEGGPLPGASGAATAVVEVERGLRPGDRIVLHPSDRLRDGMKVTPRAR